MKSTRHPTRRETRSPQLAAAPFAPRATAAAIAVACALAAGTAAAAMGSMEILAHLSQLPVKVGAAFGEIDAHAISGPQDGKPAARRGFR